MIYSTVHRMAVYSGSEEMQQMTSMIIVDMTNVTMLPEDTISENLHWKILSPLGEPTSSGKFKEKREQDKSLYPLTQKTPTSTS